MRGRPTGPELQVLGEQLMMELRRLVPFEGSWERPAVHRLLELLYRTLPLVSFGPAVCELIFEKFHQLAKQDVGQSNSRSPAEYSVAVGSLWWRAGVGGGVRGRQIGCDGGWTAFVGPTLASPHGRIGAVMSPSDWATCAWISWPLLVAVVGLDLSLLVFRMVWRDLTFALRVPCIGRLRLEAEPRAPAGRLLPHISAGWDRIAVTQRRRLACPLGAGVLACVGPLWPR